MTQTFYLVVELSQYRPPIPHHLKSVERSSYMNTNKTPTTRLVKNLSSAFAHHSNTRVHLTLNPVLFNLPQPHSRKNSKVLKKSSVHDKLWLPGRTVKRWVHPSMNLSLFHKSKRKKIYKEDQYAFFVKRDIPEMLTVVNSEGIKKAKQWLKDEMIRRLY